MQRAKSKSEGPSVRQQYIFPASLARVVSARAESLGLTKSEYVRRAIEAHDPELEDITQADLAELLQQLRAAMLEASRRVDVALARIERWPAEQEAEKQRARREAMDWVRSHPDAADAMVALLDGRH